MGLVLGVGKIFTWLYDLGKYRTATVQSGVIFNTESLALNGLCTLRQG